MSEVFPNNSTLFQDSFNVNIDKCPKFLERTQTLGKKLFFFAIFIKISFKNISHIITQSPYNTIAFDNSVHLQRSLKAISLCDSIFAGYGVEVITPQKFDISFEIVLLAFQLLAIIIAWWFCWYKDFFFHHWYQVHGYLVHPLTRDDGFENKLSLITSFLIFQLSDILFSVFIIS